MKILVTGCAGFIGYHLSNTLIKNKHDVYGIDNLNNYYDFDLKKSRLKILKKSHRFKFKKLDIKNFNKLLIFCKKIQPDIIVNLAAQAGVRYSFKNPKVYIDSNIRGFINILETARLINCKNLIYASSSSVYGDNKTIPFRESHVADNPKQIYSISKKTNEYMAKTYSKFFKINCIGLRFFTVYGPYGRPDMALFKFVKNIYLNKSIDLYNHGNHKRDFTYIDDAVKAVLLIINGTNLKNNTSVNKIYNISRGKGEKLIDFLKIIEKNIGLKAKINFLPIQDGDMISTHGSIYKIKKDFGFDPKIKINEGVKKFVNWYKNFYEI